MRKTFFLLIVIHAIFIHNLLAQGTLTPEVRQMQESANRYLDQRDYANAIMLFNQAIRLAPDNVSLRRDLAYTYYLSGKVEKAREIIRPVISSDFADVLTYQLAALVEQALGNYGRAKRTLKDGIKKFPHSGILYHSQGNLYHSSRSVKSALESWQQGIEADPAYPLNYYDAAKAFLATQKPGWALIYGEIYLNLEQNPKRGIEIKKLMLDAYQAVFSPGAQIGLPEFDRSESSQPADADQFIGTFLQVLQRNVTAIRKGLNMESLIMLRTRFIMEWQNNFARRYPSTLFNYQDKIIHAGYFDAYNHWLFGAYLDSKAYSRWIKKHAENFRAFEKWRQQHPLRPAAYDPKPM